MVILGSFRQLIRTPVKTVFFFVLLACTITFFILGCTLWSITAKNIDQINHSFTTIGTVDQKPKSVETDASWSTYTKQYTYRNYSTYGSLIPLSVLNFKGANYIQEPEKRPYYYAYDPGYVISDQGYLSEASFDISFFIVEVQPEADCVPDQPVKVKVKKILMGSLGDYMDEIWFCDSMNKNPEPMYADKTYIMCLQDDWLNFLAGGDKTVYMPAMGINSAQFRKDGSSIPDTLTSASEWYEVTDNFFDTPIGRRWQILIDSTPKQKHFIPVIPTNSTKLLMTFYNGDAKITEGRDISSAEYQTGEKVCLVKDYFAKNNKLKVGDSLHLPLLYADYRRASSASFPENYSGAGIAGVINAKGEAYSVFEDSSYKIVGIYDSQPSGLAQNFQLGENAVVIPSASVKNSDENNIVYAGPMREYSTSFQIPNGQIDKFMAAWQAQNISGLDIKFYDKGYTKIRAGLDSMMNIAIILFAVGAATTLFVLILFCHLFITKQRKRTAIERSLGMSKRQCMASLLAGLMIIVVLSCAAAGVAGSNLTAYAVQHVNVESSQSSFNTMFSDWVNGTDADSTASITVSADDAGWWAFAGAAFIPLALLIAWINIRGNLKQEPLKLLGEKER